MTDTENGRPGQGRPSEETQSSVSVARPGASVEVLTHHAEQHARVCPSVGCVEVPCGCGRSLALLCGTCLTIMFVAAAPGLPHCSHASAAIGGAR